MISRPKNQQIFKKRNSIVLYEPSAKEETKIESIYLEMNENENKIYVLD